ncbi:uncharacterized protein SOCE26_081170 [Sorangium cellulosum]|uniref:Lipase n=1 Tax=Sorangium cellulosum TaxID=56 RepID=A0A2L0F533_SORCE|nr:hypothetical protein [Sorangium cellulosum]AUX46611.1 uncharacterized protein SOCE26_081170 [Sorangium cellulosum]
MRLRSRPGPRRPLLAAIALPASLFACTPTPPGGGASHAAPLDPLAPYTPDHALPGSSRVDFQIPRRGPPPFYALPWPSELLRRADGAIDWSTFPGAGKVLISTYLATAESDSTGFSITPSLYFHFSSPPDVHRLPARPADTTSLFSPVFLVDVDPQSPDRGAFIPLELRYFPSPLRFIPAGTLAAKPIPGVVLRPGTLHLAVVRRDLGDPAGQPLGTTLDLEKTKWTAPLPDPSEERARALHAEPLNYLASGGLSRAEIAAVALFRTGTPHAVSERLFDAATHLPPALGPRLLSAAWQTDPRGPAVHRSYFTIAGHYCTPNFQSRIADAPFLSGGGALALGDDGAPRVVEVPPGSRHRADTCGGLLRARYVLTVPKSPPPPGGFPLLVTAHGTGGDATTFLGEDNFAGWAARQGIAAVSTDQPLHGGADALGARPGSRYAGVLSLAGIPAGLFRGQKLGPELAFYNPLNPAATRDNLRQAGVDASLLARVIVGTDLSRATRPGGGVPLLRKIPGRAAPRFDKERILLAGHSQGSQSAAVQAALDPLFRGVILSGCGGDVRLGILRRNDLPVMPFIGAALGLRSGELTEFHPFMTLVQGLIDPVDPQSYARLYREPLPGRRPQNVLHYGGLTDTYTPPETAVALAIALGATPLRPVRATADVLPFLRAAQPERPLSGNLAGGQATAAFVQVPARLGEDGHFVLFHEDDAARLAMQFMRSAVASPGGPAEVGPAQAR